MVGEPLILNLLERPSPCKPLYSKRRWAVAQSLPSIDHDSSLSAVLVGAECWGACVEVDPKMGHVEAFPVQTTQTGRSKIPAALGSPAGGWGYLQRKEWGIFSLGWGWGRGGGNSTCLGFEYLRRKDTLEGTLVTRNKGSHMFTL